MAQKFTVPITVKQLTSTGSDAITVYVDADTYARLKIEAGGRLTWGPGNGAGDVNLYRDGADVLRTDDTFKTPTLYVDNIEIDPTGAQTDYVLKFDGTKFTAASASFGGGGATNLDGLTDVVITAPEEFQSLSYNGTNWVNGHIPVVSYVRNAESTTLTTGTVVYLFGATGDHATVKRADKASDTTSSKTVGLVGANIAASQNGPVITRGYVDGIDLSVGYSPGDILWLGSNGTFTKTKATAPDHLVFVGVVVRATNNGIVYVATQNGYELDELHNVAASSPSPGDFLKYNGSLWVNDQIDLGTDTTGNYVQSLVAGTGITLTNATASEGGTPTIAVTANTYQPLDADLTAIAGLTGTSGLLKKTAADTWTLDTATYVSTADTGTVTSTMIADGTIVNADVNASAAIAHSKLANATPGQVLLGTTTTGVVTATTVSGDVTITGAGVTAIGSGVIVDADINASAAIDKTKISGTAITAADTGTVTSTMIADGTIVNADINNSAAIALSKLASGTSGQVVIANASGVPTYTTLSGDVTVSNTGVVTIAADSVALGTDTTGNYVQSLVAGTGITLTNATASEGGTPTIAVTANTYQPLDADLTAIAGLAGTSGVLKKTAADTWALDTSIYVTTADTGTVTSAMIANGTIVDADINSAAAIALSKLSTTSASVGSVIAYNGSSWAASAAAGAKVTSSTTPPASPTEGDLWLDSANVDLYVRYSDTWVQLTGQDPVVEDLNDLADVTTPSPKVGDVLTYDGTYWTSASVSTVITSSTAPAGAGPGSIWFDSDDGKTFINYDSTWVEIGAQSTTARANVSATPPASPAEGDMWFDSDDGRTYTYYDSSWVELGASGFTALVSDSAPANPVAGQIWYKSDTGGTYIYYGTTWIEIGASPPSGASVGKAIALSIVFGG